MLKGVLRSAMVALGFRLLDRGEPRSVSDYLAHRRLALPGLKCFFLECQRLPHARVALFNLHC